jgi:hypothetical protein
MPDAEPLDLAQSRSNLIAYEYVDASTLKDRAEVRVYAYGLEPETVPTSGGLIVGHPTRGQIGAAASNSLRSIVDANGRMYPSDLSCYVTSIDIERGRQRATESFDAGQMVLELDAADRRFDPLYTGGAYNGGVNKQLFRRGTPIVACVSQLKTSTDAISAQEFPLFSGWVDRVEFTYSPSGTLFTARVTCLDAFTALTRVDLNAADITYGAGELLGARVQRWMEVAGLIAVAPAPAPLTSWTASYYAGPNQYRRYGTVQELDGVYELQGTQLEANALAAIKQAAASSDAWVMVNAKGDVCWGSGHAIFTGSVTFGDTATAGYTQTVGTEVFAVASGVAPISAVMPLLDTEDYYNVARFARDGGTMQTSIVASDDEFRVQQNRTDLINTSDADVRAVADLFTERHATPPVNCRFTTDPWTNDAAMLAACYLELTRVVRWQWAAAGLDVDGFISGISHQIRPGNQWQATYTITQRL